MSGSITIGGCTLWHGDCLDVLPTLDAESVDSCVCDPPYHLTSIVKRFGADGAAPAKSNGATGVYGRASAGFMGKQWDGGDIAFRPETWAEVIRVMKPGAHLVAFGSTRGYHRMVCAIEDAGFEIRDQLAFMYGVGFPKSLNVSKALQERGACSCHSPTLERRHDVGPENLRGLRRELGANDPLSGGTEQDVLPAVQGGGHRGEALDDGEAPRAAAGHDLGTVRPLRGDGLVAASVEEEEPPRLLREAVQGQGERGPSGAVQWQHEGSQEEGCETRTGEPGLERRGDVPQPEGQLRLGSLREVPAGASEHGPNGRVRDGAPAGDGAVDRQATPAGRVRASRGSRPSEQPSIEPDALAGQPQPQDGGAWPHCGRCGKPIVPDGLGTALKPSFEPIVLARKPLACPTVAANVLEHGTGALNIDGCRVGMSQADADFIERTARPNTRGSVHIGDVMNRPAAPTVNVHSAGRWPANLCHDGSPEVLEAFGRFGDKGGGGKPRLTTCNEGRADESQYRIKPTEGTIRDHGDGFGNAARFFPALGFGEDELRFMYSAKASKADRAGSSHPTVKPQRLLRWLSRLITPPGGTILDPFAGSGSLGTAALAEGFSAVLIEREAEYFEDALRRLTGVVDGDMPLFSDKVA